MVFFHSLQLNCIALLNDFVKKKLFLILSNTNDIKRCFLFNNTFKIYAIKTAVKTYIIKVLKQNELLRETKLVVYCVLLYTFSLFFQHKHTCNPFEIHKIFLLRVSFLTRKEMELKFFLVVFWARSVKPFGRAALSVQHT